ncbi:hypothetical protein GCM10027048_05490 [Hymenobacter coalescens]
MTVLLFSGHRLDWQGLAEARFPPSRVPEVQVKIRSVLQRLAAPAHPVRAAVGSLAAGADLLFAHECLQLRVPLHVCLPFGLPDFVRVSVAYPKAGPDPTPWEQLFEQALRAAATVTYTTCTGYEPQSDQFARCNRTMLRQAVTLAAGAHTHVQAVLFLQAHQPPEPGGSRDFLQLLHARRIPTLNLGTSILTPS